MSDSIANRIGEFKKTLEQRLAKLDEIQNKSAESRQAVELDQSSVGRLSRMDAMQRQQMAAETGRRRKIEIQKIKAALQRIDKDDFGYCLKCDEPIAIKRLEHDPSTPVCINCARNLY